MPVIRITIELDNPETLLRNYNQVMVFRASTQFGVYSEVSEQGTRLIIDRDRKFYDFDDVNGSEYLVCVAAL